MRGNAFAYFQTFPSVEIGAPAVAIKDRLGESAVLSHHVEPRAKRIVALKSSVQFRAHFEPIAEEVPVVVESPGATIV